MNKTIVFGLVFLCLVLLPFAASAPTLPFQTSTISSLQVESPNLPVIKMGEDRRFHAHVINLTRTKTNVTTQCALHVYNQTGWDIATGTQWMEFESYNNIDFAMTIKGGNFTTSGTYAYVIHCNSTNEVGFYRGQFEVTPNGEVVETGKALIYIILIGLLLFFLLLMFVAHLQDQSELAKFWWFAFMWIPIWAILFIGWNMARDFMTSNGAIEGVLWWAWLIIAVAYPFFLLGLVIYTFYFIYKEAEVQRLIDRGFSLEDAQKRSRGRGRM